jgi:hypothetical protein
VALDAAEVTMMVRFKEYIGTIEFEVEDALYEIGLREEDDRGLRGIWTCVTCGKSGVTSMLMPTTTEALELAKVELMQHHREAHRN